jgi:hypothetical protein
MSKWKELIPAKILDIIFLYLNNGDEVIAKESLVQFALTCHHWKGPAQRVFFSEITLSALSDIEKLFKVVLQNEEIGRWVKALCCKRSDGWNSVVLLAIHFMLPTLKKIDFHGSSSLYSSF